MVERYKYKCINAYEEPENPMEWLPCPRCGLRPLVWEFDNGRVTNNRGYYCMYSCCCNIDREDNTDVIYKEVKRS